MTQVHTSISAVESSADKKALALPSPLQLMSGTVRKQLEDGLENETVIGLQNCKWHEPGKYRIWVSAMNHILTELAAKVIRFQLGTISCPVGWHGWTTDEVFNFSSKGKIRGEDMRAT